MGWIQMDANQDGYYDWILDADNDGTIDQIWMDYHGDGDYDTVIYDTNDDGRIDWVNSGSGGAYREMWISAGQTTYAYLDSDHDGTWENHFYDGDRNGHYEWVRLDTNLDGHADTWVQNPQYVQYQDSGSIAARNLAQGWANVAAVGEMFRAAQVAGGVW